MNNPSAYWAILKNLTLRNLRIRYRGTILGFLWAFLNPLLMTAILYVVFSYVIKIKMPQYPLFILSALLPWTFFSSALNDSANSIVDNANLVKKTYFAREILPLSYVLSNFINLIFSLIVLLMVLLIFRIQALQFVWLLPLILIIHLIFTVGLGLVLACANVYFRDVGHILTIGLLFWFYLTPIFYPLEMVPDKFHQIYMLNPMALVITIYRGVLFESRMPRITDFIGLVLMVGAVFGFGYFVFKRNEPYFTKEI